MKKHLHFQHNNAGFILPYVLLISTLIFIVLSASITTYQHDVQMMEYHIEQMRIETIIQMGYAQIKRELLDNPDLDQASYTFPDGNIDITVRQMTNNKYQLHMMILTNNGSNYKILHYLFLE